MSENLRDIEDLTPSQVERLVEEWDWENEPTTVAENESQLLDLTPRQIELLMEDWNLENDPAPPKEAIKTDSPQPGKLNVTRYGKG